MTRLETFRQSGPTWALLIILSAAAIWVLTLISMPAPILLGAMFASIILATRGRIVPLPAFPMALAQGIIGLLFAHLLPPTIWSELAADWYLVLGIVLALIVVSFGIGLWLAKMQILPGTTAIWGASPGAASAIILMSESSDADVRLVAFMQYLRLFMVATVASLIARFALGSSGAATPPVVWFAPFPLGDFLLTMLIAASGMIVTRFFKLPVFNMILPMAIGIAVHTAGISSLTLPPWLLAGSYVLFGWSVGLRFSRDIVVHAWKALPVLFASTFLLIVLCALMGLALSWMTGMDILTAYLATSPGGADSIAIIAAGSPVNKPFVLAVQTARFLIVLLVGPLVSRTMAASFERAKENAALGPSS